MENFCLIIPTRGDRPKFLQQCRKQIARQTLQPNGVIWMDYAPEGPAKDITQRYRRGVEQATKAGYEFVVFWEDDDWYHPDYLKWLVEGWKAKGKPNFYGVGETYYYHLGLESHIHMKHAGRTSMFCTLAKLPWRIQWPADSQPFLDMHIHRQTKVVTVDFPPNQVYAIGIKHGIGKTGGGGHNGRLKYQSGKKPWFTNWVGTDLPFYDAVVKEAPPVGPLPHNHSNIPKVHAKPSRKIITTNSRPQLPGRGTKVKGIRR